MARSRLPGEGRAAAGDGPRRPRAVRSGYSNGPVMANFRAYGLDGVLQKPFDTNELVELVKSTIRG
jgi:hypothetical protein